MFKYNKCVWAFVNSLHHTPDPNRKLSPNDITTVFLQTCIRIYISLCLFMQFHYVVFKLDPVFILILCLWICTHDFSACLLQELFRCTRSGVKQLCTVYFPARAVGVVKHSSILHHPLCGLMGQTSFFTWCQQGISSRCVEKHITLNWDMCNAYILRYWKILHTFKQIIWNTSSLFPSCKIFFCIWPWWNTHTSSALVQLQQEITNLRPSDVT